MLLQASTRRPWPHSLCPPRQQLPPGKDTIFVARGAWVDGRINITRHDTGPVTVVGHGVVSGRRFKYHGGAVEDSLRCIEVQYDRPLVFDGPTLVDPKGHALFAPPHSTVSNLKVIGWLYNEDGIWITSCAAAPPKIPVLCTSVPFPFISLLTQQHPCKRCEHPQEHHPPPLLHPDQ